MKKDMTLIEAEVQKQLGEIGGILRDARLSKGMNQTDIYDISNFNAPSLSKYEHGERTPSLKVIMTYLMLLDINLIDVIKKGLESN